MARAATTSTRIRALRGVSERDRPDRLVTEEPLEIRVQGLHGDARPVAVTMRTPGADFDLAVGYCLSEGIVVGLEDLESVNYCRAGDADQDFNVVTVKTRTTPHLHERSMVAMNSSCGVCGKSRLDDVVAAAPVTTEGPTVSADVLLAMPDTLRAAQPLFATTGGIHAAARFTPDGELVAVREDIGRHNALDKLVGDATRSGALPLAQDIVVVSGRVSFEIVQKCAMAGVPIVVAVSAPSSLAVETARAIGQTVVGFVRDGGGNVYTHAERILGLDAGVA